MAQAHALVADRERSPKPAARPTATQRSWLARGLDQPGGKLPLFDENGKRIDPRTVRRCLDEGWAEPWFMNAIKPDWMVCKLTTAGRLLVSRR
ncbi:MAG: hypothetical protein QNJ94_07475 [Alphaproteobacteria bacterium]|nr:hypothetical protein [Alphaproteobacteria bacterium]